MIRMFACLVALSFVTGPAFAQAGKRDRVVILRNAERDAPRDNAAKWHEIRGRSADEETRCSQEEEDGASRAHHGCTPITPIGHPRWSPRMITSSPISAILSIMASPSSCSASPVMI